MIEGEGEDAIDGVTDEPINAEDLFGIDDDPGLLPELDEGGDGATADGEGGAATPAAKKPRAKMDRCPNLNEKWICGPGGVDSVASYFKGIKLKGKGHEAEDLSKIMKRYQYWAHQCYPKLCFKDFVEKVEYLSTKRMVKAQVVLMRNKDADDAHKMNEDANQTENALRGDDGLFGAAPDPPVDFNVDDQRPQSPPTPITEDMKDMIRRKREEALAKRQKRLLEESSMQLDATLDSSMSESRVGDNASASQLDDSVSASQFSPSRSQIFNSTTVDDGKVDACDADAEGEPSDDDSMMRKSSKSQKRKLNDLSEDETDIDNSPVKKLNTSLSDTFQPTDILAKEDDILTSKDGLTV